MLPVFLQATIVLGALLGWTLLFAFLVFSPLLKRDAGFLLVLSIFFYTVLGAVIVVSITLWLSQYS